MNNRSIKFRAWDKNRKVMLRVDAIDWGNNRIDGYTLGENRYTYGNAFTDVVLMQSTGLQDKNGKDVFEGDIIQFVGFPDEDNNEVTERQQVKIPGVYMEWGDKLGADVEVIGDIYTTPELLQADHQGA